MKYVNKKPILDKLYDFRLHLAILVVVILLVMISILSIDKISNINNRVHNIFTQELIPLETIEDIKGSMYRVRDRANRHLTEPERHAIHEKKIDEQLQRLKENKQKYKLSRLDDTEIKLLDLSEDSWNEYVSIIKKEFIPLSRQDKTEQAENVLYGKALDEFRHARAAINALSDYQLKRAENRQTNAQASYISILRLILGGVIASTVLFIILIVRFRQTQHGQKLSEQVLNYSSQGVMVTDSHLKIISVNHAFEKITGYRVEDVIGKPPSILSSSKQGKDFYIAMWQQIKSNGMWEGEIWNKRKDGEVYPQWLNIIALKDKLGNVERYAGTFIELTKLKKTEETVNQLAYYDKLTGLCNQALLEKKLNTCLSKSKQSNQQTAILLIDLDNYKEINNSLGRNFGDTLLQETSLKLKNTVPENCVIARHDSDRFVVALSVEHLNYQKFNQFLGHVATKINTSLSIPVDLDGNVIKTSCTIGISSFPQDASEYEALLKNASIALQYAKKKNRGAYSFYESELGYKANYQYQLGLGISRAIELNELYLVYQPQIDRRGDVIGAEVLLRWRSKEFGIIPPDIFIPLAEEKGEITSIGRWVFQQTAQQIKEWRESGLYESSQLKKIAINVSPHQIMSENIYIEFNSLCEEIGIDAGDIEIEITETSMMNYSDRIITQLKKLDDYGFDISLDDFGTGYSSLGRLHHFPIRVLKVDRSFTQKILADESQAAIVQYIINMAHTLDMKVVVEGVENAAEVRLLLGFGCDIFQGYYFSKPLDRDDFFNYIENHLSKSLFKDIHFIKSA